MNPRPYFQRSNNIDDDIDMLSNTILSIHNMFIDEVCNGDIDLVKDKFRFLISYISKHLPRIDYKDIELVDRLFDVFCDLCLRYNRNPTGELYMEMVGLYHCGVYDYIFGNRADAKLKNEYERLTNKWKARSKAYLIDDLSTSDRTSVNKIFISKAQHQLYDVPVPKEHPNTISSVSLEAIAQKLNAIEDKMH